MQTARGLGDKIAMVWKKLRCLAEYKSPIEATTILGRPLSCSAFMEGMKEAAFIARGVARM
jgi:hypothetical protein